MRILQYSPLIRKISLAIVVVFLSLLSMKGQAQTTVTVDPATKYQTIKGWGVSLCWWANILGGMPQADIDTIAKMATGELNFNVFIM